MIKYHSLNSNLFTKHFPKLSSITVSTFGSIENITLFLYSLCETGSITTAARQVIIASSLQLHRIIHNDRALSKCVRIALQLASEKAESVLYDRAINGYEEVTYNKDGEIVLRKKKYCSKSLLEYLRANSTKYKHNIHNNTKPTKDKISKSIKPCNIKESQSFIPVFTVKSYDELDNE